MKKLLLFLLTIQIGFSQEFMATIRVENVIDLVGMSVYINYNPQTIEVIDSDLNEPGTQLKTINHNFLPNSTLLTSLKKDSNTEVEEVGTLIIGYTSTPLNPITGDGDCFSINKYYFLDIGHFLMWVDISYTVNDVHQLTSDKITDIAWLSTFQPLLSRR